MNLVGVTGKSGAGKTTFSNYLKENSKDIEVIHIDDLLRDIKLKYFKFLMKEDKNGEETKVDSKLKNYIYKTKPIFFMFSKFRAKLIEPALNRKLKELQGKRIVIIDDIFIKYHKIYKDFKQIYLVERTYVDRKNSLQQRDDITKEEIVAYDMAHFTGNYKEIKDDKRIIKIKNDSDEETLRKKAREVYLENMLSKREKMLRENKVVKLEKVRVSSKEQTPKIKGAEFLR